MQVRTEVVYYAFGGGMGHATRASAILRALRRMGHPESVVFTNSPYPLPLRHENIPHVQFSDNLPQVLRDEVPKALADYSPEVVVVDVFPSGVVCELDQVLPRLRCRKIFVYRHVKQGQYMSGFEHLGGFDFALLAEESRKRLPCPTVDCSPILIRNARELLPRREAKARLGVAEDEIVVLAVNTSSESSAEGFFRMLDKAWRRLNPRARLRLAWPGGYWEHELKVKHYPLIELFNGVDVVIGAGGYNLVSEVRATGVQGIFIPQIRRYDDQFWRVQDLPTAASPEELEQALSGAIDRARLSPRPDAVYKNGAATAARAIAECIESLVL